MNNTTLLIFGIVVFGLMLIGIVFTVLEFSRLSAKSERGQREKQIDSKAHGRPGSDDHA